MFYDIQRQQYVKQGVQKEEREEMINVTRIYFETCA